MTDLFTQLQAVLLSGDESLEFSIKRDGDRLAVLLVPRLAASPSVVVPPHVEQARAALSLPLYLQMTGPELDACLVQRLQGYTDERRTLRDALDLTLQEIRAASKTLRAKATPKAAARGTEHPTSAPAAEAAESPDTDAANSQVTATGETPTATPVTEPDMSQPLSLF